MYVLVTYDVATSDEGGARRLRRVAKLCTQYGQRVQMSVFECLIDPGQYEVLKRELGRVIDADRDSLRFGRGAWSGWAVMMRMTPKDFYAFRL